MTKKIIKLGGYETNEIISKRTDDGYGKRTVVVGSIYGDCTLEINVDLLKPEVLRALVSSGGKRSFAKGAFKLIIDNRRIERHYTDEEIKKL